MTAAWVLAGGAAFLLAAGDSAAAADGAPVFTLSDGTSIALAPAEALSCDALRAKLHEIDATGYRGASPTPRRAADARLLDYETEVSMRYYNDCVDLSGRKVAPSSVFRGGFD